MADDEDSLIGCGEIETFAAAVVVFEDVAVVVIVVIVDVAKSDKKVLGSGVEKGENHLLTFCSKVSIL